MERLEDGILTVAKQDQVLRLERHQLTTQLGADRSHHLQVAEAQAELGVIVVDEPDGRQSELRVRVNFFDDHLARGARAGNQYSPVTVRRPALGVSLARDSQEEPRRRNYCDAEN